MIKSMTGFGKAEVAIPDKKITVEIRTLNSKQLDLAVKLPSAYRPLEYEIRALAAKALQRGKADLYISVESTARQTRACIDEELFHLYYNQLLKICREQPEIGTPGSAENNALIQSILRLPDVVCSQEETVGAREPAGELHARVFAEDRLQAGLHEVSGEAADDDEHAHAHRGRGVVRGLRLGGGVVSCLEQGEKHVCHSRLVFSVCVICARLLRGQQYHFINGHMGR